MKEIIKICKFHGKYKVIEKLNFTDRCGTCKYIDEFNNDANIERIINNAYIPYRFLDVNLDNFILSNDKIKKVIDTIKTYDLDYNLFLLGSTGTGKTHIGISIIKSLATKLVQSRYIRYDDLIELKFTNKEEFKELSSIKFLVIDEFGFNDSNYRLEVIHEIIAKRYDNCLFTCLISNLNTEEIKSKLSDAIFSRLTADGKFKICRFEVTDFRINKNGR